MTGNIILISGISTQAKLIQKFQCKADKESGIWNHSGIRFDTANDMYIVEMAVIEGRKLKAACKVTPMLYYTQHVKDGLKILELVPKFEYNEAIIEGLLMKYTGTPYDYWSLIHDQVIRTLHKKWVGRTDDKAARKMVCHEFAQFIWNCYHPGIFPEWWKGDISQAYHSYEFEHMEFTGI